MKKDNLLLSDKPVTFVVSLGLLIIVFIRPLISGITFRWSNTYLQVLLLFLLVFWLLNMIVRGEITFLRAPLCIPMLLFTFSLFISLINSVNRGESLRQIYQFCTYPVIYLLLINHLEKEITLRQGIVLFLTMIFSIMLSLKLLLALPGLPMYLLFVVCLIMVILIVSISFLFRAKIDWNRTVNLQSLLIPLILLTAILVNLYGIYQHFWVMGDIRQMVQQSNVTNPLDPRLMSRIMTNKMFSTFVFPPALAGYLIIILPLALTIFVFTRSVWYRVLSTAALITSLACLYLTYSKGGWLCFILSMTLLASILLKLKHRKHYLILITAFVITILLFLLLLTSNVLSSVNLQAFTASFKVRLDYAKGGVEILKDYLYFGSGLGTFGSLYAKYKLAAAEETQFAHNNYLQVWIETGIPGIISFLWIWAAFLKSGWKRVEDKFTKGITIGCYVGITAFLIHNLADFNLYIPGITTYVFLFMGIVVSNNRNCQLPDICFRLKNPFRRILLVAVTVLAVIFLMIIVSKPLKAEKYYQEGRNYIRLNQGLEKEGIRCFKQAIRLNPDNAQYHYYLGSVYARIGLIDEAIEQHRKAVSCNPFMAHYHGILGKLLWHKAVDKDTFLMNEAVLEFEKARDYYPTNPKYRLLLGRAYELSGRKNEAVWEYTKALELDSSLEEAKKNIARLKLPLTPE